MKYQRDIDNSQNPEELGIDEREEGIKCMEQKLTMHIAIAEALYAGVWEDAVAILELIRAGHSVETVYHAVCQLPGKVSNRE
ncbi:hypothetical protein FOIG_09221 [Fusarium odoratissimum NRRL 54006]|uniref:Uncharacterized protein n=2 Tax=Fusarium oxysporum species complex TaxID=171631 RepID=X0JB38_FUSO5|nr:uncharacterized protein FOIG_09221 [Fusarium odoratissimum NRRL 54006]EXL98418.1 hypothetical protein FOIG_09221 [Fusarium odoratissimum NRRL 54006]TXC02057.1 hypothetical protein FocTR4_00008282 [Fusarium oxysporum f. sp. cubense]